MRLHRNIARTVVVGALVVVGASCKSCKKPEDVKHTTSVHAPTETSVTPIQLEPIPEPPAVKIPPGSMPDVVAGPVTVVVAKPQGEARYGEHPAITFNKPLIALGDRDSTPPPPIKIAPKADGAWQWIGSSTVEFVPDHDLPYGTKYTVTVDAGLKAIDGEKLAQPYSFTFDTLHPRIEQVTPQDGFPWMTPDGKFDVTFNMPMKDVDKHVVASVDGVRVPFTVTQVDLRAERAAKNKQPPPPPLQHEPSGLPTTYRIAFQSSLRPSAKVSIAFDNTLTGTEGPIAFEGRTTTAQVAGPFKFTDAKPCSAWGRDSRCPYGPVSLWATNEPDVESLRGHVHFKPDAVVDDDELSSYAAMNVGAYASVSAKFRPGTDYTVTVDAGVKDIFGQSAPAFSAKFHLDDVEPELNVDSDIALLERTGDGSYPVEAVNIKTVHATVEVLPPDAVARILSEQKGFEAPQVPPSSIVNVDVDTSSERNVAVRKPIALAAMAPDGAPKLFRVTLRAPEIGVKEKRTALVQITDVAAHAKIGATSGVVWVTSLSKGTPIANANVRLLDATGKEVATATTDADGIAKVPGGVDLGVSERQGRWTEPRFLVVAESGGDTGITWTAWSGEIGPSAASIEEDWEGDDVRDVGAIISERGIYRPGDEVYVKGVLRLRQRGVLSTPKLDSDVEIDVEARGKQIAKQKVPMTKFGTFFTKVKVPENGALGVYDVTANAVVNKQKLTLSTSFRVEEYRAPKFKVDLHAPKAQVAAGDHVIVDVDARYLFGGTMPGSEVEATMTRESAWFHPDGFDNFTFGVDTWGFDDNEPAQYSDVVSKKTAKIGDDGKLALDMGEAEPIAGRTSTLTVEADVADVSRQRVAARTTLTVHPADVYAGVILGDAASAVNNERSFGEVGKPMRVSMIAVDVDGKKRAGVALKAEIKRREWKSIKKKDPDTGRFTTMSEPEEIAVSQCAKTSDANATVACDFTPDKAGLYIVDVTATDAKGRASKTSTSSYVTGGGWVSWQRTDGDLLEIVADKKEYAPGETAKLLVKSPWPDAEAIVTVEREGVLSARHMKVSPGAAIPIQLDDNAIPNVFVSAILVRGRIDPKTAAAANANANANGSTGAQKEIDPGRPQVRVGYTKLVVSRAEKKLAVDVDVGKGAHRPGEKTKIAVHVKGADGKGVVSEVALWAVDEAVLRLTDYSLPDLVGAIHPERGLSVRLGEPLVFLVRKQDYGEKGRPPGGGGGGGAGSGFRSNFKTTAFFKPDVVTDESGSATIDVTLPDDLTTYRVMAIAVTEGDRAGSGRADLVVSKPLLALPAFPRLARVGDTFSAGVIVHSESDGDVVVKATADAIGFAKSANASAPNATGTSVAQKTVHVDAGKAIEVRFPFEARDPGRARLRFEVTGMVDGKSERDGVEHFVPIVLPMVKEVVATSGTTNDKRTEALAPPKDVWPNYGGLDVTLASTELAGFQEAMEQLVEYPYGCAEQQSSRLVPFLALRELEGTFGVAHKGTNDPEQEKRERAWLGFDDAHAQTASDNTVVAVNPDDVAKKTVRSLLDLQNGDGGFRYWPTGTCSDAWASSYVTLAIARAAELGYPVPKDAVTRAQKFLAEKVAADNLPSCGWWHDKVSPTERAFAVWVLARTGASKPSFIEPLYTQRKDMPLFAKAMLADAAFIGRTGHGPALLQELMNASKETARDVHFEEGHDSRWAAYWSSDARTSAIVLMTLVDMQPDHPYVPKIVQWLLTEKKNGRFRTTQEAAFALMAMTEVVRAKEREAPDYNATVTLGPKQLVAETFRGRSLDAVVKHIPMSELSSTAAQLVFQKNGTGLLSYTASLTYAHKEMPTKPEDAGIAVQRWFEPWLSKPGSGQAHKVRAGELVRLKVRIATSAERRFVAVDVPLPAGLEIVDTSLATTAALPKSDDGDNGEGGGEDGDNANNGDDEEMWSPFDYTEYRDDRALFFADRLPPGVHTATVAARATTAGVFVEKPATAEEMYSPEVSGRSDGGTFEVVDVTP